MGKKRIYELAKEWNKSSKEVVEKAQSLGFDVKNHMGAISDGEAQKLQQSLGGNPNGKTSANSNPANQKPANQPEKQEQKKFKTQRNNPNFQNRHNNQSQQRTTQSNNRPAGQGQVDRTNSQGSNRPNNQGSHNRVNNQENRNNQGQQNRPTNQGQQNRPNNQGQQNRPTNQGQQNRPNNQGQQNRPNNQGQQNRPNNQGQQNRPNNQGQQNRPTNQGQQNRPNNQGQQNRPTNQGQQNRPNNQGQQNRPAAQSAGNTQGADRNNNRPQGSNDSRGGNQNRGKSNYGGRNNNFNNNNRNKFNKKGKKGRQQTEKKPPVPARKFRELPEVLEYSEGMNVADIAKKIYREPAEIIKKLFMMGVMVNQNQPLDKDTIELLATDYGIEPQEKVQVDIADIDKFFEAEEQIEENLVSRPPVVTIMGHVDHGKTTLLDTLRHSRVTSGEAGGITQHIGAYQIDINGKPITFLDTPGHAAFTSMRARGASITDITILVVAADDGVMPQTVEAINHAKAAKVPIIVAVNKIDKPGANPQHVMQELSEHELIPEAWGGDTIFVEISAKFGQNIEELLEMILLVAEVEDLKADPTQRAIGTVIEARLDKGKGPVATLLVQQGTLHVGDPIVVGNTFGRVRVMTNDLGRRDKAAGPATPVEITGLNDVPQAGDRFVTFEDEKTARAAGEERAKRALMEQRASSSRVTLDNLFESLKEGELKEVNVIIKADVQGSAEALAASLKKIDVEGVRVNIVHSAVGAINESDVTLAAASNAIIIGFNVRPTPQAKQQAEAEKVDIRLHRIIYKAIEEIETAMKGMLDPEFEEKITGQMIVRETYKVSKVGTIAGCYVTEGSIRRDSGVRVIRDGIVIYEGKLASLKRFKDDVKEVKLGFECGAMIEKFNDLKVDDVIEGYVMEEVPTK
ncbi:MULTISPECIES: translation initiation factor IF-2 [Enterococcus]|jgi:translation initiation factor IF-2|uniref:translation initiation factor IF-2 n=1 Tax=Enterococcus TaxID=1350 RepID=UPI0018A8F30D|nr:MULTISPECIES: translation initiation factor IF-2 [Enterococcus]MDB1708887.1 translation initiation factor IF-2 [Enterococcus casseliflavus]MDB1716382.1 translation initiation factor IF-2 [Enterococcus casseliflavus]